MKRFIVLIIIAYILGIIIGLYKLSCIVLFLICILLYQKVKIKMSKKQLINIVILLVFFIFGVFHIKYYEHNWEKINNTLNKNGVIGEIINLEKETNYQKTFKIKILNGKYKNKKVLLKISYNQKLFSTAQIGNIIFVNCELQEVEDRRNTGGFDYKEYLKSKNIYGIMKYKNGRILENKKYSIYSIKNSIIKNTYLKLKKENADLVLALTIGYKASFDQEIKENFSKINLSHLLAISGMHISYLVFFISFIFKIIKSKYKSIILILFLIFLKFLIGDIPSVNRVCIIFILRLIAPFFYRKSDNLCNFALSSGIILFQNPYCIKDLGFIFSYIRNFGHNSNIPDFKRKD